MNVNSQIKQVEYWYQTKIRPVFPLNKDWESEANWAKEMGFSHHLSVGYTPWDLPNLLKGKRRRSVNGVDLPCALDHLTVYCNPTTKKKVGIFHEYPGSAESKEPILREWCQENGLRLLKLDYSWYYPNVTRAYMICE